MKNLEINNCVQCHGTGVVLDLMDASNVLDCPGEDHSIALTDYDLSDAYIESRELSDDYRENAAEDRELDRMEANF
jgi:hypothetical protein